MRRTSGRATTIGVTVGLIALAACSPAKQVSEGTSAPNDSSADETSAEAAVSSEPGGDGDDVSSVATDETTDRSTEATDPPADDRPVALPGLLDDSDDPIPDDDEVRTGTLDNGLRYYVRYNDRPGAKAALRLAIDAGSVNESGPHTGVAHFVEHMLFNGTERFPENELIDLLRSFGAAFGADVNAYTSFDETVYELDVPNDGESVDAGMTILEEWLSHATFDPDQVEAERGIVLDEWRQSTQTTDGRLFDVAQGMYLVGTPYEDRDPIGSAESITNVPQEELRRFYDEWYRPDNAAVIVVGDIDVDDTVADIERRFGSATPRVDANPPRPDTSFAVDVDPAFALHSDPDQTTVDVEVDLPLPATEGAGTAAMRAGLIDSMIFEALIGRLDQDITTGAAPFDEIVPGTNTFVETLDAPALYAITTADRVDATLQALLDEYARAERFGFTEAEVELVKASVQADFDSLFDGRNTTQDVEYATQYVANFLNGEPYPDAGDLHEIASEMIAAITPAALDLRFRARWDNSAPHVIISTPELQAATMPSEAEVLAMIAALDDRPLEPRDAARDLPDELMAAPEPVPPESQERLLDTGDPLFDPVEVVFPNGARVIATSNDIVEGQVGLRASSPGGSSLVADADVVDALYAADIVTSSGVGEFNQTELERFLADRDAGVGAWITPYTDNFAGSSATSDIETLFQLLHLYMTRPRFDPVALNQLERFQGPVVDDPASDPDLAGYDALLDARYPGQLRYAVLPTPEQFGTLDLEGVERVWRDRYGDASDWVFAFAGDIDLDRLFELAARYIGTLPGSGTSEQWVDVEDRPPEGAVRRTVRAGTGDTSSLMLLFTSPIDDVDGELRATLDVVTEVITTRLTDVVRERLGESYSPYAFSQITSDPELVIETYVQVTGDPGRIESVADLVIAELADLAAEGPTEREFSGSFAQVEESYGFVNNDSFLEEMLTPAIWPDTDLQDYLDQYFGLGVVRAADVQRFIADHVPADRFIQVVVLPR